MTHREQITDLFLASEMQWEAARLKKKYSKIVDDASRELFGYTVKVPADIAKVKRGGTVYLGFVRPSDTRYELCVLQSSVGRQQHVVDQTVGRTA